MIDEPDDSPLVQGTSPIAQQPKLSGLPNAETAPGGIPGAGDSGVTHGLERADAVLAAVFVVSIFLPGVQMLWPVLPEYESFENRTLAQRPAFPSTRESAMAFPSKVENYFDDHFGFRNTLIRWNNLVRVEWLRSTSNIAKTEAEDDAPQITAHGRRRRREPASDRPSGFVKFGGGKAVALRGKEDWIFLDGPELRAYYRGELFTDDELAQWIGEFRRRGSQFAERGVRYVVVVCPSAHSIYPEFLPHQFRPLATFVRLDQLVNAFDGLDDVSLIDLRPAMREAKEQLRCYHRTDSHWNDFGAYVAYVEIMEHLCERLENVKPWDFSKFEVSGRDTPAGDLARSLGLADRRREDAIKLIPLEPRSAEPPFPAVERLGMPGPLFGRRQVTTHPNVELPRAVVVHDSFAFMMMPFLSEHFSYVKYVFYATDCIVAECHEDAPDVVIQLFSEVHLVNSSPHVFGRSSRSERTPIDIETTSDE